MLVQKRVYCMTNKVLLQIEKCHISSGFPHWNILINMAFCHLVPGKNFFKIAQHSAIEMEILKCWGWYLKKCCRCWAYGLHVWGAELHVSDIPLLIGGGHIKFCKLLNSGHSVMFHCQMDVCILKTVNYWIPAARVIVRGQQEEPWTSEKEFYYIHLWESEKSVQVEGFRFSHASYQCVITIWRCL